MSSKSLNKDNLQHLTYMQMATNYATLSVAQKKKVGCIIVSQKSKIIAQGFNHMPNEDDCCEYIADNGHLTTKDEVIHAESDALLQCAKYGSPTNNATLYVTMSPCINCAKLIFQAGIKKIFFKEYYKSAIGIKFLLANNVKVYKIENNKIIQIS